MSGVCYMCAVYMNCSMCIYRCWHICDVSWVYGMWCGYMRCGGHMYGMVYYAEMWYLVCRVGKMKFATV